MKKKPLLLLLAGGLIALLMFQSSAPPPPPNPLPDIDAQAMTLEQAPPLVTNMWVQKLQTPLPNGNNMLFMLEIDSSVCYDTLTDTLDIYYGSTGSQKVTFFDNGTNGDVTASDNIYSAYVTENIQVFRNQIVANENALITSGHYLKFNGHTGEDITAIPHFDAASFDAFMLVPMHPDLTRPSIYTPCTEAIYKERSLFITDSAILENEARTFNTFTGAGNVDGAWTFGTMIKNMANKPVTGITPKEFLKEWLRQWTDDVYVNGQLITRREDMVRLIIFPWLLRSHVNTTGWEDKDWGEFWDKGHEDTLLKYAPFKLLAIVNRIDLRGSAAYSPSLNNAGETRFIFTAIETDAVKPNHRKPIVHVNQASGAPTGGFMDWEGFNIIFEYGNVAANLCEVVELAEAWKDLSNYDPATEDYAARLQAITDQVTLANAGSSKGKPNGSAINKIRTNERILQRVVSTTSLAQWEAADWEFRQFELDPGSNMLIQTPLTNTPVDASLSAFNLHNLYRSYTSSTTETSNFIQWAFYPFNQSMILKEKHQVPFTYPTSPATPLLAGAGKVSGEYNHYLDLMWWDDAGPNYDYASYTPSIPRERNMRHIVSLNTCQGCHNGETKTVFTQVRPTGYGDKNRYWQTIPDYQDRYVDNRFVKNMGVTIPSGDSNYKVLTGLRHYQHLSPFLTGRHYGGLAPAPGTFFDDSTSVSEDASDNNMNGLYYVNDPANDGASYYRLTYFTISDPGYGPHNIKFGYNDLERRKQDLCHLISAGCGGSIVDIATKVNHRPLPFGSH